MKNNIMKCVIGLLLVCVLFVACDSDLPNSDLPKKTETEEKTKMIIKNQSSIIIDKVHYCGTYICYVPFDPGSEKDHSFYFYEMSDGDKTGYIYFELLARELKYGLKSVFNVKTNEVVSLKKGCTTTFIITDNTLVVPEGKQQSFTILDLMTPGVLEIVNNSSIDFYNVEYKGEDYYSTYDYDAIKLQSGKRCSKGFYTFDDDGGYIYFIVFDSKIQDKRVRIAGERIKLEKGKKRTISIDESTMVYLPSENTEKTLGEVIK